VYDTVFVQFYKESAKDWTAETLDKILTNGDNLYTIHNVDLMLEDFKQECPNKYW